MCSEQMKILISGHLDGCNTPKQEATLTEHLNQCAECRRLLHEYQAIDAELAGLAQAPPAGFSASVMNAISQEAPRPKKAKRHSFRYGTMIAAAAAVLVLAVSAGHIVMPKGGFAAIHLPVAQKEDCAAPTENYAMAEEDQVMLETKTASGNASAQSANVDCAALADIEGCYVGLLYADGTPELLKHSSSLPLSGGTMYTISQETLNDLKDQYPALQIFAPENTVPPEDTDAYLILVKDPA